MFVYMRVDVDLPKHTGNMEKAGIVHKALSFLWKGFVYTLEI